MILSSNWKYSLSIWKIENGNNRQVASFFPDKILCQAYKSSIIKIYFLTLSNYYPASDAKRYIDIWSEGIITSHGNRCSWNK